MPRLLKATALDRWIDAFADMPPDDQAFALAQVQAIHRQAQRKAVKNGNVVEKASIDGAKYADQHIARHANDPDETDDLPFDSADGPAG